MTPQECIDTFRRIADDGAVTIDANAPQPYLWSDAVLMTYMAEGQLEACRRAQLLLDSTTPEICEVEVEEDEAIYEVDSRIIIIKRVKLQSQLQPLDKISVEDMDLTSPGWEDDPASDPIVWLPWEDHKVRLHYKPDADDVLRLRVIREPLAPPALAAERELEIASITAIEGGAAIVFQEPQPDLVDGDYIEIAGADQVEYNGSHAITVVDDSTVNISVTGTPDSPATGTITASLHIPAYGLEIPTRYHIGVVNWMLHKAYLHRERQDMYRPEESARYLALFEEEFGKKKGADQEVWTQRKHGYDHYDGHR